MSHYTIWTKLILKSYTPGNFCSKLYCKTKYFKSVTESFCIPNAKYAIDRINVCYLYCLRSARRGVRYEGSGMEMILLSLSPSLLLPFFSVALQALPNTKVQRGSPTLTVTHSSYLSSRPGWIVPCFY